TEAGDCDCQLFQAQGSRCQIVPNTGKDRDGICKSWGQYHFETFDGIYYYFPGNCSYIFAKDCGTPEPQYTVWVHNSPDCYGSVYSCQRSVSLFFSNQEEIIISGHEVRKEGKRLMLPQTVGNVFVERLADYILVKTTFGFSLAWDGNSGIYIKLTEDHKGKPCGLCGNFNGNKYDDLILQNSEHTEDIAEFANSWAVQTPDDAACVPTASDFSSPCSDIFFKCQIFLQFPFFSCHESIDPYSYISSCMNDLCRVDDDETYCRAVTEYARACSHAGSPVRDWRDDFPACTETCEDSFVHRDCISCCPPTCTFEKDCLGSNLHCLDGCYCPDGLIMENGTCISVSNCPCTYHGTAFSVGSKIEQECSNCICTGGIWNCTDHDCPAECSITGNSHFTTFDGRHFTFLGICQYILVKGTGKNKFTITLQKASCGQNFDHACIESITLVLEDDMSKQVTLTRNGQVQTGPNQAFNLNGAIEIRNISSLFVQLKTTFGLKILFAKDGERIYVQVDVSWKRRTLGLCGTYNGNLRDDFLSPAGMIEGTPQLHANAWKVSSACSVPINIPVVDPCNINQQNVGYASHCDIINQEVFAPCHAYISPALYYQLCRFDACKCGSSCLCNALAHYAYVCGKHGIAVDFRSHISYCAVMCHSGMLYHQCSSFCKHSCASLSMANICGDDCAEGCNCPDGKYFEESVNFCVSISACRCHYKGKALQPGEILPTPTGSWEQLISFNLYFTVEVHTCPEGKIYYDCRSPAPGLPAAGVNCGISCANLAMNFSCVPSPPCASGCICPPGMAEHRGKCYIPDSCPCTWKDREFLSGEVIATPCYTCVCRRGIFNCTSYPCPAVCTIYGDRHYYTFDGLEYDYVSDCQAYLLKSTDNSNISIIAQNKKCFDNDIVCSKNIFITVGDIEIYFSEPSEKQGQENKSNYQLWKAGYYTVIHFPEQDITILWDKKTMMHIKVGPRWKGKLAGLCGNFDKYTSNDLTTSNNMEVRNAQVFGDSWVLGQCKSPNETLRPCEVHQSKFPYAKKECSILYSDVFAPCRNVIDVTSFVKNCHTDTCNCNLGGDCECLCTSIAAYAHKCCQQGAVIHWRSPSLCGMYLGWPHTRTHSEKRTSLPRYLEPVDKCSQYICVNMGWMLYNLSRNCPKDVKKPDCGFRGMPVQVNNDSCCPEWECPCQCSVLSELSVITFDGNNIALCNMASYILVKLPGEIIVAHIEKCPSNQVSPASTSGLCFKKLNVTTHRSKLLINRLARKVVVDSVIPSLPFSKEGLSIQDTGAMYVINTPAGISIKWAHVTGIIDIQYGLHSNTSMKTEGLCGVCNGDPSDDLKMQNRTIITNMEEIEMFIKSWAIEKLHDVTTRRPVRNCTEDNCTYCIELLNRSVFIPCHKKVSPQEFCEKMWINSTHFWNYECDALSAYVALCNKHNICIKWRTSDYCSLSCPEGKEYQPCVQPCEAKTCLNKWLYEDSPCSYLREDCVCKNGTILHRTDSDLCIPEEKCTCTDNRGQPHSAGEIWNESMRGCCMYNCLENGSVVAVEPECNDDPPPACEREGEVIIHVIEERACCPKKVCECNMSLCDAIIPTCKTNEKLVVGYNPLSCCPEYRCECDPSVCFNASQLDCREDQFIVEAKQEDPCCFSYVCVCESCIDPVPLCNEGEILTVDLNTIHYCCPHYYCVCDENLCSDPPINCTDDMKLVKEKIPGRCCPEWHCECSCENATMVTCKLVKKDDVCIFQEVTVLNPGQSVIQYLDGDLCYTVQCLQEKDHNTGYNAMHFTTVNCSQQCEAHQIYIPSPSRHSCCGTCLNVSCFFHTENGTQIVYEEGSTWSSNCTNYKCTKTAAGAMILGSGCTKVCTLGEVSNNNSSVSKKEERICQKMTIRTTIRKNDCISQSPINVASCDGKCPSATIFNVNIDSHLRFCKCCRENGTRNLTVPLHCAGNGTEIMYVIQEPIECSCQWN
uniref:Otogelin like n=1 Tax=Anas platyrhynchos platyrhynchos TaxID=8840 RepID=U3J8L8_ANAPP